MEWYEIVVSILTGIATAIPLIVQLVKYVKLAIQEKNWNKLLDMIMNLMEQAEGKFDNGVDKKKWVLAMIQASADTINYTIDINQIGALIDSLCDMSRVVNAPGEVSE